MEMRDYKSGLLIQKVLGIGLVGDSFEVSQLPAKVMKFDSENINGIEITEWEYLDGEVVLEEEIDGFTVLAFDNGQAFNHDNYFINNMEENQEVENEIVFRSEYLVEDLEVGFVQLHSEAETKWYDESDSTYKAFPFTKDSINPDTDFRLKIKQTVDETFPNSNIRDSFFTVAYIEAGNE
jgi:hypothetical protein